ncbi:threonine-phosphate decarboxylase [Tepidanaerobacter sp. GT38]|uniref:threonine-phosphate decarboxylase CobD n=1 Tax=Tepidanaerobacter sp. GT38 TaxID=2722793 RepID=UPI001F01A211|nr:threonine-phosphate decarboxylase CobD [Tepidanaerobacter sp. GT38]MCG1012011.1 threonine-phosphate decarboxylase [Tepidanaerobacter sp. GT38]
MKPNLIHGGNVYKAAQELNISHDDILDFSANINPLGFPEAVKSIILNHIKDIVHYPDVEQIELKKAAAEYYGTSPESIMPGNGSVELIHIVLEALRPSRAIIPSPTFAEYAISCQSRNIDTLFINLRPNNFKFDFQMVNNLTDEIIPNSIIILCNPNNPTGLLTKQQDISVLLDILSDKKAYLLVDEAFMDFVDVDESMATFIEKYDNLMVLKSVTKFFALPGLRLGFVLACPELIKRFYTLKDPWNINTFAGLVGAKVLQDKHYIDKTRKYIREEKLRFWENLKNVPAIQPLYPEANFIFIKITAADIKVPLLAESLKKNRILIRDCSNYMFLDDSFFRVAVKRREDNDIFVSALKEVLEKEKGCL